MKGKAFEMMRALRQWELDEVETWLKRRLRRGHKCLALYRLLRADYPDYPEETEWKRRAFPKIYSRREAYHDKRMRALLSEFSKYMEGFFIDFHMQNDPYARRMTYLREMRRRHSDRLLVEGARAVLREVDESPERGLDYYRRKIELEEIVTTEFRQEVTELPQYLDQITDLIERYHVLHRIDHHRALIEVGIFNQTPPPPLPDFYRTWIDRHAEELPVHRYAFADISDRESVTTSEELNAKLEQLKEILPQLSRSEKLEYVFALQNQATRAGRFIGQNMPYNQVNWNIRELLIDDFLWEEAGNARGDTFRNTINIALNINKIEWAEQFLEQNIERLSGDTRIEAEFYCRAQIALWKKDYETALAATPTINIKVHGREKTLIRVMLTRIYFALIIEGKDYFDSMDNHLNAFEKMVWRNYRERPTFRRRYLTMIQTVRKMVRHVNRSGKVLSVRQELIKMVESQPPFPAKYWFAKILKELR